MANKPKNKGGRPPKWANVDEMEQIITWYFLDCDERKVKPSKAGLAWALDSDRETLSRYIEKPGFSDAIKNAYRQIERAWVERLGDPGATGAIFYLKNAYSADYRDKTETDITSKGEKLEGSADIAAIAAEAARILKEKKL